MAFLSPAALSAISCFPSPPGCGGL